MDPDIFEGWRKEQQARIDEKIANGEEIHVPLHNLFWSDGTADKVPGANSKLTKQEDITNYLKLLSTTYSKVFEVNLVFTSLPINYTVWKQNAPRNDLYLYGNPRGRFPSTDQFVYHVWHLLNNKIAKCDCKVCQGKVRGYGKGMNKA